MWDSSIAAGRDCSCDGPAGVPVAVQRAPGAAGATIGAPRLEVSWDDGATWRPVTVHPAGGRSAAHADLTAPRDASSATLRVQVAAGDGSSPTQTVTRAFGVGAGS
ncbi:hypothetical protein [Streptomyces sp. NRRL F-5123]|uniref:hypothetical protein n=1 Tax=Streptomyces sp. NRRL F-5123 TaxID=1463856 RepID=UPI0004E1340D|nr:hypothetical protein [Streptomyces sp. NRRL F-5123]